jgi:hypothetical protein
VGRFERRNVLFLDFAENLDETAYHPMKKLLGSQLPGILVLRDSGSLSDRLHCRGLLGLS